MPDFLLNFSSDLGAMTRAESEMSSDEELADRRLREFSDVASVVEEWRRIVQGPPSKMLGFAHRATMRVEPVRKLDQLILTWNGSFALVPYWTFARVAFPRSTDVALVAASRIVGSIALDIHASDISGTKAHACRESAVWDLNHNHDLGNAPLWPFAPPHWYSSAEEMCRELEAKTSDAEGWIRPRSSHEQVQQFAGRDALDRMFQTGELDRFAGKYVISDGRTILASGRNLLKARFAAERKANRLGIAPERLVDYFVPKAE